MEVSESNTAEPLAGVTPSPASRSRVPPIVAFVQGFLIVAWTLVGVGATGSGGEVAYAWFIAFILIYPVHLAVSAVVLWWRFRRGAALRQTLTLMIAPWLSLPLPWVLNALADEGPLLGTSKKLVGAIAAILFASLAWTIVRPRRALRFLPTALLESKAFNVALLVGMVSLYVVPLVLLSTVGAKAFDEASQESLGHLLAYGLGALVLYSTLAMAPAIGVALYGYVALGDEDRAPRRGLYLAQLGAALPLVLLGAWHLASFVTRGF